jgi:protein CpxP
MKNKSLIIMVLALLLSNIVLLFFYLKKCKKGGRPQMVEQMAKEIGFDNTQKDLFVKQRNEHMQQTKPLMDSVMQLKKEYITKLMQQPNDSTLQQYTTAISTLMFRMDALNFASLQESKKICTPQQMQAYDSIVKKIMLRMPNKPKK